MQVMAAAPATSLEEVFFGFTLGAPEMEGKTLVKVAKDCNLIGKTCLTTTDIDLIFAKVKTQGAKKITLQQFLRALEDFAVKKKVTFEDIES